MKLKVSVNDVPYNGYTNIDPSPNLEDEKYKDCDILIGNPTNLSMIEDSTCEEILIRKYIEYINVSNMFPLIEAWCKKLRHGGTITISGLDFDSIIARYLNGEMNLRDVNAALYGEHKNAWDIHSLCINGSHIADILKHLGLSILSEELINNNFIIRAKRT